MRLHGLRRVARFTLLAAAPTTFAQAQLRGTDGSEPAAPIYRIKPSEVPVPVGAKPGDMRRMIQPFATWTLICDDNLKAHTRLCNVSQTFVDEAGTLVYSWSLAATGGGTPVFILRAPMAGQEDRTVRLGLGKPGTADMSVPLTKCDARICLGFLPLGPEMRRAIAAGSEVRIQRADGPGRPPISLSASLSGLSAAIASIK